MTLYEEYQNGLNLTIYCQKAYQNLVKAVRLTALEEGYTDQEDIEILWEMMTRIGNVDFLSKNEDIRNLIKTSFNMHGNYIDSRMLSMIRDFENMSIQEFLELYNKEIRKTIDRNKSRSIKKISGKTKDFIDCASITGFRRNDNQDFACTITSPINENCKLLVVCDGVGGSHQGDKASEIVTKEFIKWFNTYDFEKIDQIDDEIKKVIENARTIIRSDYFMSATTLTFAIETEKETIIGNVGDSRAYIIKDKKLKQITKDDSEVWKEYHENPKFGYEKDILRFMPRNNVITNAIDFYPLTQMQTYHIPNTSYDGILLTTDGITDILSDETIEEILTNTKREKILDKLLYESSYGKPDYPPEDCDELLCPVVPGKDNTTAAVYIKTR